MAYLRSLAAGTIIVTDHRYLSLQQERSYLLSALATEESRAERMTRDLEMNRALMQRAEADGNSVETVGGLKKAVAAIRRKLTKCYKSEQAMINNLTAVTTSIGLLEEHEWQKAQLLYPQENLQTPVSAMGTGLQNMTLEPSMLPGYGHSCTSYPITPYAVPLLSSTQLTMPAVPLLQPQPMRGMESAWNTPLPTAYYEQLHMRHRLSKPFDIPQPSLPPNLQTVGVQSSTYAASSKPVRQYRRTSLPNPARRRSCHKTGLLNGGGEAPVAGEDIDLGRKLSMFGDTSAFVKMQRMSE